MTLFPAIDLKGGECVRLKLGNMDTATVYNSDPAAQAKAFEDQGFEWLHVVDLDGAFAGRSKNGAAVDAILKATKNPVQLGGGIRSLDHIEGWLTKGLARVILGTVAVRDPDLVREACKKFPGRIAVGIDAKGGKVAVEGWAEASELGVVELARRFEGAGVAAIIYTDIDRDGVLTGINWESTIALAESVSIPVIASGGLASLADIVRMTMPDAAGLEGAISGRALYDGRIDPAEALSVLRSNSKPKDTGKVICETPTPGKKPTRIDRWKYDAVREAIIKVVPAEHPGIAFKDLAKLASKALTARNRKALGSIGWYVTTVKLDMETRGELRRLDGAKPQRLIYTGEVL